MTFWYPAVTAEIVENMSELTHLPNLHQKKRNDDATTIVNKRFGSTFFIKTIQSQNLL
jgi:hypothetical protein